MYRSVGLVCVLILVMVVAVGCAKKTPLNPPTSQGMSGPPAGAAAPPKAPGATKAQPAGAAGEAATPAAPGAEKAPAAPGGAATPAAPEGKTAPAAPAGSTAAPTKGTSLEKGAGPVAVTDATFETDVLKSSKPALVDFWATWCGPCKKQAPIVDKVASKFAGKLFVGKLDVDPNKKIASKYNIEAIPTLIIFKGGKEVYRKVGLTEETELAAAVSKVLASS